MTRWLVAGAGGMLGEDVMAGLRARGETVLGPRKRELDITDTAAVRTLIADYRPGVVINCAAWTAVDAAEAQEEAALAVNGRGAENLAAACAQVGAVMAQISTDYVFDGRAGLYAETDEPAPRTAYGRTKLAGERAVLSLLPDDGLVIRTAWLYGRGGPSFVHTMIKLAGRPAGRRRGGRSARPAKLDRRRGRAGDHAGRGRRRGIYHATSAGQTTWFELARHVFELLGTDQGRVRPTTSEAYPRPAPRPAWSVLGHDRYRGLPVAPIGDWQQALRRAWPTLWVSSGKG